METFRIAHKSHLKQNFYSSLFSFAHHAELKTSWQRPLERIWCFLCECVCVENGRQAERHFSKPESALESIEFNENLIGFHKFILLLPQCCLSIYLSSLYYCPVSMYTFSIFFFFFSSSNFDCPLRLLVTSTQNNLYKLSDSLKLEGNNQWKMKKKFIEMK